MRDHEAIKKSCQKLAERRAFICEHFPKNGKGAEIGVLHGQFSEIILRVAKPKKLYLVDPWSSDNKFGDRTPEMMNDMYLEVKDKFKNYSEIIISRTESRKFLLTFARAGIKLDFVYIDGSHEHKDVLIDLYGSWEIVKPGGIIAGDDYNWTAHWKNNVERAVKYFCTDKNITHDVYEFGQFIIRR